MQVTKKIQCDTSTPTKNPAQRPQGGDLFLFTHLLVEVSVLFIYLFSTHEKEPKGMRPQKRRARQGGESNGEQIDLREGAEDVECRAL